MTTNKKRAPAAPGKFSPSVAHQLTIGQATQAVLGQSASTTITVYGKLVKDIAFSPSEVGTVHPRGKNEDLRLAVIYGIQDQGQCFTLPQPEKVYLPSPDGPADGCGWNPAQFVVWKNLPKDWETVHVQSQTKTLAAALRPRAMALQLQDAGPSPYLEDVLKDDWLKSSQPAHIKPADQLSALWVKYGTGGDYDSTIQNTLAAVLLNAYGVHISPGSLTATMPFSKLQQLVGTD